MPKKSDPTYQTLSAQLEELLAKLQQPDCDVDEAVKLYRAALECLAAMERHLETAKNEVVKIRASFAGSAGSAEEA